jgi:hypothetical protein
MSGARRRIVHSFRRRRLFMSRPVLASFPPLRAAVTQRGGVYLRAAPFGSVTKPSLVMPLFCAVAMTWAMVS